jgi:hypothetical protein
VFALGMGLTIAPATASIMGSVSAGRAGVGSAINDTTRQVGGALGVAVMGSIGASIYRHSASRALAGSNVGSAVTTKALDSIGSALGAASSLPAGAAQSVTAAAKQAFIRRLDISSVVGFGVALAGAALAWRFIPAGMRVGASAPAGSIPSLTPYRWRWPPRSTLERGHAEWDRLGRGHSGRCTTYSHNRDGDVAQIGRAPRCPSIEFCSL